MDCMARLSDVGSNTIWAKLTSSYASFSEDEDLELALRLSQSFAQSQAGRFIPAPAPAATIPGKRTYKSFLKFNRALSILA